MNHNALITTALLCILVFPNTGWAQESVSDNAEVNREEKEAPVVWKLTPAEEPTPALRYRFWLPDDTLKPGSAQLRFARALLMWQQFPSDSRNKWELWAKREEFRPSKDELQAGLDQLEPVFEELHRLATSEDSRYDHRLREMKGPSLFLYGLPDVQASRGLARMLCLKADSQIAEKDYDGAITTLQDGFRLAAFVGQGETLVQQLIGLAIAGVMLDRVESLVQVKEGPNLFWALASLPRPLLDVNESVQFELGSIHRVFPALLLAESEQGDEQFWSDAWKDMLDDLGELDFEDAMMPLDSVLKLSLEPAKERRIQAGIAKADIDAMPSTQVVLMDASIELRRIADELTKGSLLPRIAGQTLRRKTSQAFEQWVTENRNGSVAAAIASLLFPAIDAATSAGVRYEYVLNRLMTVEALRMHAANNQGRLPDSLDALTTVPALPNPYTGKDFQYELETNGKIQTVILRGDGPASIDYMKELRLRFEE